MFDKKQKIDLNKLRAITTTDRMITIVFSHLVLTKSRKAAQRGGRIRIHGIMFLN